MKIWKGVWVALTTPFRNGEVDLDAVGKLTGRLLRSGVHGVCPCGTTGEGSSLTDGEFSRIVETVLKTAGGKIAVVPGTGSNNTDKTAERTLLAKELGAHGALVVTPYYVRPTQEGLRRHYGAVSEKADFPIMLYNVPGRTAVNLLPETVEQMAKDTRISAIKDCAPLPQISELIQRVGEKISVFSGEDGVFLPFMALGGDGIVSVAANTIPSEWVSMYEAFMKNDLTSARKTFLRFAALTELLFVEPNPLPVKVSLELLGLIGSEVRSPLAPMSAKNAALLKQEMVRLNLVAA